jgi:hypothetical protein
MAESTPAMGDIPDATAIPKANGKATNDTLIAAKRSLRQFSFSPFIPSWGIEWLALIIQIRNLILGFNFRCSSKRKTKKGKTSNYLLYENRHLQNYQVTKIRITKWSIHIYLG